MTSTERPLKFSLSPIVEQDTRVLILGTLPGAGSLKRAEYYANTRNQFWRLIEAIVDCGCPASYADRLDFLRGTRIGLWDTLKVATRSGSLDVDIRNHEGNPLRVLVAQLPALRAIAFNGGAASKIGRRQLGNGVRLGLVDLPSSSSALTMPFERKLSAWLQLRTYLSL